MAQKILVEIITPEHIKYSQKADMVVVPGVEGGLGVMAGHIPLVTRLEIGEVRVHEDNNITRFAISGGYLEATPEKAVILAESAESSEEIDVNRAMSAKQRAEERLKIENRQRYDRLRAEIALRRAANRLRIAQDVSQKSLGNL
jgi:F-type H+-transporting ATPase subunit epsilon